MRALRSVVRSVGVAGGARAWLPHRVPYRAVDTPACEACGSARREVVASRVAFRMRYQNVLCSECGLVYIAPRPSADDFEAFYRDLYPKLYGKALVATEADDRGRSVFDFLADELDLGGTTGILDIGCGDGALLLAVADGLHASGLSSVALAGCDPGWPTAVPERLPHARGDIPVSREIVERLPGVSGYSVFVMYDVVEHLLHPRDFCLTLHDLAPEGALLFVSTNCLDNWGGIPPAGWDTYYLRLAHTFTFSRQTLESLLAAAGWQVRTWRAAPKGDQWVLAERAIPVAPTPRPGHAAEVRSFIEAYQRRCRKARR